MRAERCNPKKISRLPLKASEAAFSLFFRFFTESWGANKGLGEAPKSYTRKEYESATNPIAKRGQGAIAPCRVKGQRPLWGLGQRPNCSAGDQHLKRTQQRCRQRSVPASNFARPQTRPQAALPPRFCEEPKRRNARKAYGRKTNTIAREFFFCPNRQEKATAL